LKTVRILYIDHTSELGGAERSLLDLLGRLDRERIEPILVTSPAGPLVERARALGIEVVLLDLDETALTLSREEWSTNRLSFLWKARGFSREVWRLAGLIRARDIDVVHTNTLKAHVLGSLVAWLSRRPIVWHMRDLPSKRGDARNLLDRLFKIVKPGIIAISQAVADDLSPPFAARTRVVYNGIDLDAFDARKLAVSDLPPAEAGTLIGTISHLIPWKGQDVFLYAAAQLLRRHPEARFLIVGDPIFQFRQERERLEGIARYLGISDRVVFAGHREDVPAVLASLDIFALPSLYEPFGRVLIEAMAASRPIVASRAGGVPEIVLDGQTGILVTPGDPQALADALAMMIEQPQTAQRLAVAARIRVCEAFSLDATLAGVMAAYEAFNLLPAGRGD
jgi:glycosyltransferase involved in cell wall biosynthesis